jgi:SAM-dependent methyltransferase/methyltransferase-like protein
MNTNPPLPQLSYADYDSVPYPNITHHATNPLRTAALARLLDMEPAAPDKCRVLDIGCATGDNIMAMAAVNPSSEYVGVDLSQVQIARGQSVAAALGLANVTLHAVDLSQIDACYGTFDFIIAHGLYSWIPQWARDNLMRVCRDRLAPSGIAYISYNTFPGWHTFKAYREMVLYRTMHLTEPRARIQAAKAFFRFLHNAWPADKNYHGAFLHGIVEQMERDADVLGNERDSYIFHEYLEAVNDPVYVHEFLAHAEAHDLQYLCDADLHLDFPNGFEPGVTETIDAMAGDLADYQQYMDDVRMRAFRRTLLCHKEVELSRALRVDRLRGLYLGAALRPPADAPPLQGDGREAFDGGDGITFTTNHPLTKAALRLTRTCYPETFRLEELVRAAAALLAEGDPSVAAPISAVPPVSVTGADVAELGANLLRMISAYSSMLEVWALPAPWAVTPGEYPRLSTWAQHELRASPFVTNLRHERVRLDTLEAAVARLLDGTHTAADICAALEPAVRSGAIVLQGEARRAEGAEAPPLSAADAVALLPKAVAERLVLLTVYGLITRDV